jgi:cytidylate kinase
MVVYNKVGTDGPAGAGKGTACKQAAYELGWGYFDVGSGFRSLTYILDLKGITPKSFEIGMLDGISFDFTVNGVYIDGRKIGNEIRSDYVSDLTAKFCNYTENGFKAKILPTLADKINKHKGNLIAEGRNLRQILKKSEGSHLIYMDAEFNERVKRAYNREKLITGETPNYEEVREKTLNRDRQDFNNKDTPLMKPKEALDSSNNVFTMENGILNRTSNIIEKATYGDFINATQMDASQQVDATLKSLIMRYNL